MTGFDARVVDSVAYEWPPTLYAVDVHEETGWRTVTTRANAAEAEIVAASLRKLGKFIDDVRIVEKPTTVREP
jgi:hypothetical protein